MSRKTLQQIEARVNQCYTGCTCEQCRTYRQDNEPHSRDCTCEGCERQREMIDASIHDGWQEVR